MARKKDVEKKIEKGIEKRMEKGLKSKITSCCSGRGGGFYFLGFLGAAIYYISTATGFWNGVLGVLKAIVWPAFVVFKLLKFLAA